MTASAEQLGCFVPRLLLENLRGTAPPLQYAAEELPAAVMLADVSGFTRLTGRLAVRGAEGAEELNRLLNAYFERLIQRIDAHGGDVVRFIGDAVVALWRAGGEGLPAAVARAAACGLDLQSELGDFAVAEDVRLSMRLSVAGGSIFAAQIGGVAGAWQFVICGTPLENLMEADAAGRVREVVLSPSAARLVHGAASGETLPDGCLRMSAVQAPPPRPAGGAAADEEVAGQELAERIRPFIPGAVLARLDVGQTQWLADLRQVTVLFVRLLGLGEGIELPRRLHQAVQVLQRVMLRYEGTLIQIHTGDKGTMASLAFGLPPQTHEDDAARGVAAAVSTMQRLKEISFGGDIGIATGLVFCGPLGSASRREYTAIGETVNLAARLMQAARGGVLCDERTRRAARGTGLMPLPLHRVKGFVDPVAVYCPASAEAQPRSGPSDLSSRANPQEKALLEPAAAMLKCDSFGESLRRLFLSEGRSAADVQQIAARLRDCGKVFVDKGVCDLWGTTPEDARSLARDDAAFDETAIAIAPPLEEGDVPVGRDEEMSRIEQAIDDVALGQARLIFIEGEAGIGKSVLAESSLRRAESAGLSILTGAAGAIERSTPYFAWQGVVRDLLDFNDSLPGEEARRIALARVEQCGQTPELAPLLNSLLPLDLPESELVAQLDGRARADNLHDLLIALLAEAAQPAGLWLLLEDVHWLDSASWMLAAQVAQRLKRTGLVLVARPIDSDSPPEWKPLHERTGAIRLALRHLPAAATARIVARQLSVRRIGPRLAHLVQSRSAGNPFFAVELASFLRDRQLLELSADEAELAAGVVADEQVPGSIRTLITSRIDRLPPSEQLTLKTASIIGQSFDFRLLRDVHPVSPDRDDLRRQIDCTERLELTELESPEPDLAYIFRHATIRQVTYDQIPLAQRRPLHGNVARWYEDHFARSPSHFPLLAWHWGRAERIEDELRYLELAGEEALRTNANREAADCFRRALERVESGGLAESQPQTRAASWERRLGEALFRLGQLPESRRRIERSLVLLGSPAPQSQAVAIADALWQAAIQLWRRSAAAVFSRRNAPPPAEKAAPPASAKDGGKTAEATADPRREAALGYQRLSQICYLTLDMPRGLGRALRALNLAERGPPSPELARAYAGMGLVTGMLRLHPFAVLYSRLAEKTARASGRLETQAYVLMVAGIYRLGIGEWKRARRRAEEAVDIARRLRDARLLGENITVLAMIDSLLGDVRAATEVYHELAEIGTRSENVIYQAWAESGFGECLLRMGRAAEAVARLDRASLLLEGQEHQTEEIRLAGLRALAHWRLGNRQRALNYAEITAENIAAASYPSASTLEAYAAVAEVHLAAWEAGTAAANHRRQTEKACLALKAYSRVFPVGRPRLALLWGKYAWRRGWRRRAARSWRKSLRLAERMQMPYEIGLARLALGGAAKSPEERGEHLRRARDIFQRQGAEVAGVTDLVK